MFLSYNRKFLGNFIYPNRVLCWQQLHLFPFASLWVLKRHCFSTIAAFCTNSGYSKDFIPQHFFVGPSNAVGIVQLYISCWRRGRQDRTDNTDDLLIELLPRVL